MRRQLDCCVIRLAMSIGDAASLSGLIWGMVAQATEELIAPRHVRRTFDRNGEASLRAFQAQPTWQDINQFSREKIS
jgi:hypothetical protein